MLERKQYLTAGTGLLFIAVLAWADSGFFGLLKAWDAYTVRIFNLCGINIGLALALNLVNGFTGQFSLGHAGFMAVGAYTAALLIMPPAVKQLNFFMVPLVPALAGIKLPFAVGILAGGLMSAGFGFLIGAPVLSLRGDYLAIATLGFAEIIRVVIVNVKPLTNGALGLKGIPGYTDLWWSFGYAALTIWLLVRVVSSSYGRALKAIREDEVAAQAMGVNLFYHKMLAFVLGAFLAGVGGALQASLITSIDPNMYRFPLTFQILLIVVLGGMGSITGTVIAATVVTVLMEFLRIVESPLTLGALTLPGIPGMRMVVFSLLLIVVILFYRNGIMGEREFSWEAAGARLRLLRWRREVSR
ncbi:MAG: branched-chain amino acid transport system permease protein [Bacillota bacterium]|nr:branched-chain amino acid transport system permease protein [Bacillota bacterium]